MDKSLGNVTVSDPIGAYQGYHNIEFEEAWLKGADGNDTSSGQNMTVSMISTADNGSVQIFPGPSISLIRDPKSLPLYPWPKISNKYGMEIGLPIGLVALVIIILSCCYARKKRGSHLRDVRLIGQDYMAKRARRRGFKNQGIQLDQMDAKDDMSPRYTDQPVKGGSNAFRDEIRRQRQEDDISLKRTVSSF